MAIGEQLSFQVENNEKATSSRPAYEGLSLKRHVTLILRNLKSEKGETQMPMHEQTV